MRKLSKNKEDKFSVEAKLLSQLVIFMQRKALHRVINIPQRDANRVSLDFFAAFNEHTSGYNRRTFPPQHL